MRDVFGRLIAGLGTIASNVAGRDIRLGPNGSSLGANIASGSNNARPYFSTTQNVQYAKQGINPYSNVPAGYQGKSAAQIEAERVNAANPNGVNNNGGGGGGGGGDTGGGGGGGNGGGGSPSQSDLLQQRLNGIMQRLQLMKGEGERLRGVAKNVRDEVVGNIGTTYAGLDTTAKQKRDESLAALTEADRGTVRDYANTQLGMDRSSENAKLKNRALARALGFGNSSYYSNMQTGNTNTLEDNTAKLGNERAAKLAAIKANVGSTNTWYDQKSTEIAQEAATLKSQAEREYQDNISKSTLAEQNYGIDSVDAAAQAEADYRDNLNKIDSYTTDKQTLIDNLKKAADLQSGDINGRSNIDTATSSSLSNNTAANNAQNADWGTILGDTFNGIKNTVGNWMNKPKKEDPLQTMNNYIYGPSNGSSSW